MHDIFKHLHSDHEKIATLFEEMRDTNETEVQLRADIFEELQEKIIAHARGEEKTFYSRLQLERDLEDIVKEALQEHQEVEQILASIADLDPDSGEWLKQISVLQANIEAHVQKEEDEIFPRARHLINESESAQLSHEMQQIGGSSIGWHKNPTNGTSGFAGSKTF